MTERTDLYRAFAADGTLLYVGISFFSLARLCQHRSRSGWFAEAERIMIEQFGSREAALAAESDAIRLEQPIYNLVGAGTDRPRRPDRHDRASLRKARNEKLLFDRAELSRALDWPEGQFLTYAVASGFPVAAHIDRLGRRFWSVKQVKDWLRKTGRTGEKSQKRAGSVP